MELMCLDFESVLVPEVWQAISDEFRVKELALTTKDIPDYEKLMKHRIKVLNENKIKAEELFGVANKLEPLKGAEKFLQWLRERGQVIILSDTYYEFITPLQKKLNYPAIFAHRFVIDENGYIMDFALRMDNHKAEAIRVFQEIHFVTIAVGDSYNDLGMLNQADLGILFCARDEIKQANPKLRTAESYEEVKEIIESWPKGRTVHQ